MRTTLPPSSRKTESNLSNPRIYTLPPTPPQTLAYNLCDQFPAAEPLDPDSPWTLESAIYRPSTHAHLSAPPPLESHLFQSLALSSHPSKLFFHATSNDASAAVPRADGKARSFLPRRLGALWSSNAALEVHVADGRAWQVGGLTVRVGSVMGSGLEPVKGVVVHVSLGERVGEERGMVNALAGDLVRRLIKGTEAEGMMEEFGGDGGSGDRWDCEVELWFRALRSSRFCPLFKTRNTSA